MEFGPGGTKTCVERKQSEGFGCERGASEAFQDEEGRKVGTAAGEEEKMLACATSYDERWQ